MKKICECIVNVKVEEERNGCKWPFGAYKMSLHFPGMVHIQSNKNIFKVIVYKISDCHFCALQELQLKMK